MRLVLLLLGLDSARQVLGDGIAGLAFRFALHGLSAIKVMPLFCWI